jgi:hypothetical protein
MPTQFGPFATGDAVIVGNAEGIVARNRDRVRWTGPSVDLMSRDRDGSLWVASGKRISRLDPASGRLQPHATANSAGLLWVGAAGYVARDQDRIYWYDLASKRATRVAGMGFPDPTGRFAIVARRQAAGISDARTGRHLGIELGEHDVPNVRFVGPDEVLDDDGGLLTALTSSGQVRACGDDRWLVARKTAVATSPVAIRGGDGYALVYRVAKLVGLGVIVLLLGIFIAGKLRRR